MANAQKETERIKKEKEEAKKQALEKIAEKTAEFEEARVLSAKLTYAS